jgi:hypothetical protein
MSKLQIIEKLTKKFEKSPASEEDVVYVLSRIRKILEINDYPEKFSILNFYCNLALHSRIDRYPKQVQEMLLRVHKGEELSNSIINFMDLHNQLYTFSVEYSLPNWSEKYKVNDFNKLLNSIYSDTPITLKVVDFEISIDANGLISGRQID